ncbi:uncharacterized protein [Drosophila bipectinata]|uniref:uncharacterized protein n=1 Tax=Drosophila bipectinata TaxID=42026 RepID=UPI001C8AE0DF|nr:uncharacterized protein LOC108125636 [Drosophila bipectinata]
MSQIEKETEWLRSEILPQILKSGRLLENYNESKAYTFHVGDIEIDVIGIDEAYMQTFCYRTTINFDYDGKKFQRKMVVKKTHAMAAEDYDALQFENLFSNEIYFYTEILPEIQKLANGEFPASKYFYSELKPLSAVAIFENFAEQGWRLAKERVGLSLEHATIAASSLGKFHGYSYVIKHQDPEKFAKLSAGLRESRYSADEIHPTWALVAKMGVQRAVKAVATYQPQVDKELMQKFQLLLSDYYRYGRHLVAPREPLATLCHGDYLRNNVAYKYNDQEVPQDIMMFDYQTMRVSSPMIDLTLFLSLSLYADVRYPNFEALFDEYCSALHRTYRNGTNQEVPQFLSRSELLKEYVRFMPYSVAIVSYFLLDMVDPLILTGDEKHYSRPEKDVIERSLSAGGEVVDREIAHQIKEMLELSQKCGVSIDDGIDITKITKK